MGNAVKFTTEGHVLIRVTGVPDTPDNSVVHIAIEDTGIGIPADKIRHIFGEFNQVEDERNRQFEGTGLGLAISRRLIQMMGGQVWADSVEGEGSVFGFHLTMPQPEGTQPTTPKLPDRLRSALIVDDLAVNRTILEKQMGALGLDVTSCSSGAEAIAAMCDDIDLILSDHNMPDMDGLELAEAVRQAGWQDVPFVLLSSNPGSALTDPARRHVQAVLQKPITRDDLFARLTGLDAQMPQASGDAQGPVAGAPEPVEADADHPARTATEGRRMRVLVAEDNRTNQLVFRKMTKDLALDLRFVSNGQEAVEAFTEFDPDAIFMDISMPKMDGKEATGEIRRLEKKTGGHTPIIAVTAHAMDGDAEGILQAGLDDYLTKPLRKAELHSRIERHCPPETQPVRADPA